MISAGILEEERLRQHESRWKSDVDQKLDQLVTFAGKYEGLLEMLIRRELERERFRQAVIEKTLSALILMAVVGLLSLAWSGLSAEVKSGFSSIRSK